MDLSSMRELNNGNMFNWTPYMAKVSECSRFHYEISLDAQLEDPFRCQVAVTPMDISSKPVSIISSKRLEHACEESSNGFVVKKKSTFNKQMSSNRSRVTEEDYVKLEQTLRQFEEGFCPMVSSDELKYQPTINRVLAIELETVKREPVSGYKFIVDKVLNTDLNLKREPIDLDEAYACNPFSSCQADISAHQDQRCNQKDGPFPALSNNFVTDNNVQNISLPRFINVTKCAYCDTEVHSTNSAPHKYCVTCQFWAHACNYKANFCTQRGSSHCIFCTQLKRRSKPKNISYKNEEPLNEVMLESDKPVGKPIDWTFYYNYEHNGINVKLGDCVYIAQASEEEVTKSTQVRTNDGVEPKALMPYAYAQRVQFLIKDAEDNVYISGHHFYSSEQMKDEELEANFKVNMAKKKFKSKQKAYPNYMVNVSDCIGWTPIHAVTGHFAVLYEEDYNRGQLTMFDPSLVFPVIFDYSYATKDIWMADIAQDKYHKACRSEKIYERLNKDISPRMALKRHFLSL